MGGRHSDRRRNEGGIAYAVQANAIHDTRGPSDNGCATEGRKKGIAERM